MFDCRGVTPVVDKEGAKQWDRCLSRTIKSDNKPETHNGWLEPFFPSKSGFLQKPPRMRCVLGVATIVPWGWSLADQHPGRYHGKSTIFGCLSAFVRYFRIVSRSPSKSYVELWFDYSSPSSVHQRRTQCSCWCSIQIRNWRYSNGWSSFHRRNLLRILCSGSRWPSRRCISFILWVVWKTAVKRQGNSKLKQRNPTADMPSKPIQVEVKAGIWSVTTNSYWQNQTIILVDSAWSSLRS